VLLQTVSRALEHRALSAKTDMPAAPVGGRSERNGAGLHAGRVRREERTIKRSVVGSGHGLHSGVKSGLILHPLPPGRGIVFASLSNESAVPAHLDYVDSTG
jgi:hypothetical protein